MLFAPSRFLLTAACLSVAPLLTATFAHAQVPAPAGAAPSAVAVVQPAPAFAVVNGQTITQGEYHAAYSNYLRQTYYHGKVPDDKVTEARDAVTQRLVDKVLVLAEARRRGITPDEPTISTTLKDTDLRYANNPLWQKNRESLTAELRQQLTEQSLLIQIETKVRTIPEPTDAEAEAYFKAHPELFTEPEKIHLHTILLKVEPSAPKPAWDAARAEAARIAQKLKEGAAFEDLARLHSNDRSAEQGGDMGYLHLGMIPDGLLAKIGSATPGSVSSPIDVLEGVAIFRINARKPPRLMDFKDVSQRARDLLKRESIDKTWTAFLAGLRQGADIKILDASGAGKR